MTRARRVAAAVAAPALLLASCAGDTEQTADANGVHTSPGAQTTGASPTAMTAPLETAPFDVAAARSEPLPDEVRCQYERAGNAARPVDFPPDEPVTATGTLPARIELREGTIDVLLDRAKSPCAVNSFVSLAHQGYFTSTICHRLTTRGIYTLHCGDPTGTGIGGPGYVFNEEFPADQLAAEGGSRDVSTTYPRGTVAMRSQDDGKNGSQFFIVYDDSPLPPVYTVIGTVTDGLDIVSDIASAGATPEHQGSPRQTVQIMNVVVDD